MSAISTKGNPPAEKIRTTNRGAALYITLGMFMLTLGLAWGLSMLGNTDSLIMNQLLISLVGLCGPLCPTLPVLLIWGGAKLLVSTRHRVSIRHFFQAAGLYWLVLAGYTLIAELPQSAGFKISYMDYVIRQAQAAGYGANGEFAACLRQAYLSRTIGGGWLGMVIAYPLTQALTRIWAAVLVGALMLALLLSMFRVRPVRLFRGFSAFAEKRRQRRLEKRMAKQEKNMGETPIYGMNNPATENPDQESAPVPPSWYQPAPIYYAQPVSPQPPQKDEKGFYPVSPDLYEERFPMNENRPPMEEPDWRRPMEPKPTNPGPVETVKPEPPVQPKQEVQPKQPVPPEPPVVREEEKQPEKDKPGKWASILNRLKETGPISKEDFSAPKPDEPEPKKPTPPPKKAQEQPAQPVRPAAKPVPSAPASQALDDDDDLPWDPPEKTSPAPAAPPILPKMNGRKAAAPVPSPANPPVSAPQSSPAAEKPEKKPDGNSWAAQVSRRQAELNAPPHFPGRNAPQQVFTDPAVPITGERIAIHPRREKEEPSSGVRLDGTTAPVVRQMTMEDQIPYEAPPIRLLKEGKHIAQEDAAQEDEHRAQIIEGTLRSFAVESEVKQIMHGPAITRFAIQIAPGVKVNKVANTSDNLALELKTPHVRVESPIQGTNYIGIEVPNKLVSTVALREVLDSPEMRSNPSPLLVALGKDIAGSPVLCDLSKMPHLLIAGATGSGKSVCINSIVCSLLYRTTPEQVRLIMVDPKQVELSVYNTIPHLLVPVVSDPKKAAGALNWVVQEMLERYSKFSTMNVRNLAGYNKANKGTDKVLPNIVVIIDEMADLMEVCRKDVEESIRRLAALARAAGIYMVLATQRPSVDVITGVIKNNIPSRIAFAVSSGTDSRTIIDINGAEKLMGKGDMLYKPTGSAPMRVQGCFVSDEEVTAVAEYIGSRYQTDFDPNIVDQLENSDRERAPDEMGGDSVGGDAGGEGSFQELLQQAIEMAVEDGQTSTSMLQRRLRVGYARAGRLIDEMEKRNIISRSEGSKPRKTLITREQYAELMRDESC